MRRWELSPIRLVTDDRARTPTGLKIRATARAQGTQGFIDPCVPCAPCGSNHCSFHAAHAAQPVCRSSGVFDKFLNIVVEEVDLADAKATTTLD
jgi:hypothetical protein